MKKFYGFFDNGKYKVGCNGGTIYVYDQNENELAKFKGFSCTYKGAFRPGTNVFVAKSIVDHLLVFDLDKLSLVKKIKFSRVGGCQDEGFAFSSTGDLFYEETCYLYDLGVISGSDQNGAMQVNQPITRGQLAKAAFRGVYSIKGRDVENATIPSDNFPIIYEDLINANQDYSRAARALLYLEYGDGVAPFDRDRVYFAQAENITRLHTLKVLMETFNIQPNVTGTNNPFPSDSEVATIASKNPVMMGYIRKAASLGIITTQSTFKPNDPCKRGEAFAMLTRIMQKVDAGTIADPNPNPGDYFQPLNTTLQTISLGLGLPLGNFNHYTKSHRIYSSVRFDIISIVGNIGEKSEIDHIIDVALL